MANRNPDHSISTVSSSKSPLSTEGGQSIVNSSTTFKNTVLISPPAFFTGAGGKALTVNGNVDITGVIDPIGLVFTEQSSNPQPPAAGEGTLWVRDDSPSNLIYTDDDGNDFVLSTGGVVTTLTTLGGTEDLLVNGTGPALTMKGLTAGTGISLTPSGSDVTIASTASATTLQTAYDDSTPPTIVLGDGQGGILIRDDTGPAVTGNLLAVQDNAGTTDYFSVTSSKILLGRNTTIDGDLSVTGTTTTINSQTLNVEDNFICLNKNYNNDAPLRCGQVYNIDPEPGSGQTTVAATGFTAGVAAVSNPTVSTVAAGPTFSDGDFIIITGANDDTNNGIFEVLSHAANLLTIRGVGTTGNTTGIDFLQDQFATDTTVAGTITRTTVSVLRARTDGAFECGSGSDAATINGDFAIIVKSLASTAGNTSLVTSGSGPDLGIKSLEAGTNITFTDTGGNIKIDAAGGGGLSTTIGLSTVTTFTSSGTFVVPDGVSVILAYCQGGGGGGGGGGTAFTPSGDSKKEGGGGGGGGSGRYREFSLNVTAGDELNIIVGSGGTGGSPGSSSSSKYNGLAGTDGGDSAIILSGVGYLARARGGEGGGVGTGPLAPYEVGGKGGIGDYGGGGGGSIGLAGTGGIGLAKDGSNADGPAGGDGAPGHTDIADDVIAGGEGALPPEDRTLLGFLNSAHLSGGGGGGGCPTKVPLLGGILLSGSGGYGGVADITNGNNGGSGSRYGAGGGGGGAGGEGWRGGFGGFGRSGYVVLVY